MTTIDSKKIFVINGSGGVGKDTFVQFVSEFYCRLTNKQVINYSSVYEIKKIAKDIGWTGSKTERDRKFLCDLKLIVSEYNDLPFAAMRGKVDAFKSSTDEDILFLHIREPEEIKRAVQEFNAITILVKRDNIPHITSNLADDRVFNYDYDIVYVGRLTYQKNPEKLIQVMNAVYKKYPFLKCAIIGDGDLLNSIKELVYKSGVDCYIDFLGFRDNPLKIIHDSKILLMTSRFEGTPMCILEAMAIGTPVVSTPTDGICDLIDNEINGSFAESVEDLAEKSFELITNSNKRDQYSKASIAKFNQLINIDRYVCEIKESYLN